MVIFGLILLGLCLGSFVNALVWRVHEQAKSKKPARQLSITKGRSMCPHCRHELAVIDLLPIASWLALRGKCRYCRRPISAQYPLVEAATALLFVASYVWWPVALQGVDILSFGLWLIVLTGLMALLVYDLRWMLLPDRVMLPLAAVAALLAIIQAATAARPAAAVLNTALAVIIGGGLFYVLYHVSAGKWIGGGDVKLGWLLGLIVGTPALSLLMIFLASLLGSLFSLPLLANKRLKATSKIPFGPFLIIAAILVRLFGQALLDWYRDSFLILG